MNEKFKIRNLTFQNRYCPSSCFLGVFRNCIINKRINVDIWQIIKLWVNQNHGVMCCFEKLSIPSTRKGFFLRPPHPSGNPSQASYIYLDFWAFEKPHPQGLSNPLHGRSMDIFWNYTMTVVCWIYTTIITSRWLFCRNPVSRSTNQPIRKLEFMQCMKVE